MAHILAAAVHGAGPTGGGAGKFQQTLAVLETDGHPVVMIRKFAAPPISDEVPATGVGRAVERYEGSEVKRKCPRSRDPVWGSDIPCYPRLHSARLGYSKSGKPLRAGIGPQFSPLLVHDDRKVEDFCNSAAWRNDGSGGTPLRIIDSDFRVGEYVRTAR